METKTYVTAAVCKFCQKSFYRRSNAIYTSKKLNKNIFCSRQCSSNHKIKNIIPTIQEDMFIASYTPISSYILGFIWADGCIRNRAKNKEIVIRIAIDDARELYPVFKQTGKWRFTVTKKVKQTWKDTGTIYAHNKKVVEFLCNNGYSPHSKESANEILDKIPKELHRFWFLGLIDGDGCWYFNHKKRNVKVSISSYYNQDWNFVENFYKELGIDYKISRVHTKYGSKSDIIVSRRRSILLLGEFLYQSRHSDSLGLKRKHGKWRAIFEYFLTRRKRAPPTVAGNMLPSPGQSNNIYVSA
jgi:hypothetical protein